MPTSYMLSWVQTVTILVIVFTLFSIGVVGIVLKQLVRYKRMLPATALGIIDVVTGFIGLVLGPIAILMILVLLWPQAARWIVNTFVNGWSRVQLDLVSWLDARIVNPELATAIGLILQKVQFGMILMAPVVGVPLKIVFKWLMGRGYHADEHIEWLKSHSS